MTPREWVTAEEEYKRNPDLKSEEVEELLKWMQDQKDLPTISEQMAIRFYHSCYYDMKKTQICIKIYFKLRLLDSESSAFFTNRDVRRPELITQLEVVEFGVLPVLDNDGNVIICHRLRSFEASRYVFPDSAKLLNMAFDHSLRTRGTHSGLVVLFDMRGVSFSHLLRLKISLLRKFFIIFQEALPVRLKAIHVVNTLPLIDKVMMLIRPFLKKEIQQIIRFHSSDYSEIQKFIPKSCLPEDYGGDLPSFTQINEDYKKNMLEMADEFLAEEKYFAEQLEKISSKKNASRPEFD